MAFRLHSIPLRAVLSLLMVLLTFPVQAAAEGEIFPLEDVARGQKGWGLTVFAGTEPERFEVEVLGVVQQSSPGLSYILAKLSGNGLEEIGVAAGMSGSPIYFDDRLAGAVAYSYPFDKGAVAGITPIEAMRDLFSETPVAPLVARSLSAPSFEELVERRFDATAFERALEGLRPRGADTGESSLVWTLGGFGEHSRALVGSALGSPRALAGAGGGSGALVEGPPKPGGAIAAVLVEGDLVIAAHGTVTTVEGDEVLALGHPLFGQGPLNLPMAHSEVITVLSNAASSFKISNVGPTFGAFDVDREAGLRGKIGVEAPVMPLSISLRGLAERDYQMGVAQLPTLRHLLLAASVLGVLDGASYSVGPTSFDLEARYQLRDHGILELRQSFDGDRAALELATYLMSFTSFFDVNAFESVEMESVEIELVQHAEPRMTTLVAAHAERRRVAPGERLGITLELMPWRGEAERRRVEVTLPENLEDGRYYLLLGDGTSMDAARSTMERRVPQTFDQALRQLRSFHSRNELLVYGLIPRPGLAIAGESLPNLPGSVRSVFAASGVSPGGVPLGLAIRDTWREELERPIEGAVRIDLEVRRRP